MNVIDKPIIITPSVLPDAFVNVPYSQEIKASGGSEIFVAWNLISGSLPDGFKTEKTDDPSVILITGISDKIESSNFTLSVIDSVGQSQQITY